MRTKYLKDKYYTRNKVQKCNNKVLIVDIKEKRRKNKNSLMLHTNFSKEIRKVNTEKLKINIHHLFYFTR